MNAEPFTDRHDAGRQLASRLHKYEPDHPVILALPRGGVPVGYEIAQALHARLDVLVARKLGAPHQPELGIGAVAPGGILIFDSETINALGISVDELRRLAQTEAAEMQRRVERYRGDRPPADLNDQTVIVVDDGLATGVTAYAAVLSVRKAGPKKIVLAAPVCAHQTAAALRTEVDDLVCVVTPPDLGAVGLWYRNFDQTTDDEVVELLEAAGARVLDVAADDYAGPGWISLRYAATRDA
jgi:predicted phosphoribosyltransferase